MMSTGRYAEAKLMAERAARIDKKLRLEAMALQAEALSRMGEKQEAISLLEPLYAEPKARRLRLILGELYIDTGKRAEARKPLMSIISDYNDGTIDKDDAEGLAIVGRAAHLLRSARDANDAYTESERAGKRLETLLWRADLFLEKYDPGHADEVIRDALRLAPHHPEVLVAKAKIKLEQTLDFGAAERAIDKALAINPNLAEAFIVRAGIALRDMDIPAAERACDQGLAANPGHLELLSIKAATRFLADDIQGYERIKAQVFAANPEYSRFYNIVGEYAEWEHRYDEIVEMMREATKIDARDGKAWADMGLNLIRAGDEAAGLEALRKAWRLDKFNVRVFNTLNLYEKDIESAYETVEHGPFRIRYAKAEKAILSRYIPKILDDAWASMTKRYGFVPREPLSVEFYASAEHFSVRTSGLPNVGIQGVCFGRTLAMMSPSAQSFNFGNVLWHELAHVFAIQLSKNRVPRWFTEGLSEYETIIKRPEWQREEDPSLYLAIEKGKLPPITDLNRAFTRAESGREIITAYYASSQAQIYLIETFGMVKAVDMLKAWGEGLPTERVIENTLGVTPEELNRGFLDWMRKRLSRYDGQYLPDLRAPELPEARSALEENPESPIHQVKLALALAQQGQLDEAFEALDRAVDINPIDPDAHYLRANLLQQKKDYEGARKVLLFMIRTGYDGYAIRMRLAELDIEAKRIDNARFNLNLAREFDRTMVAPLRVLYGLERDVKRDKEALELLEEIAFLDQHDAKVWGLLLEGLVRTEQWEKARKIGESAIFVDIANPDIHILYARALSEGKDHRQAIFELESALACSPPAKKAAGVHALIAKEHLQLGDSARARTSREEALRLDPENEEAKAIPLR